MISTCWPRSTPSTDTYLSLHGGSGTPDDAYAAAARAGISKININSELRFAYRTTLERQLPSHPHEYATVKLIGPVIDAVQAVVEAQITAFGSTGHRPTLMPTSAEWDSPPRPNCADQRALHSLGTAADAPPADVRRRPLTGK